jgi:hypothetical protein
MKILIVLKNIYGIGISSYKEDYRIIGEYIICEIIASKNHTFDFFHLINNSLIKDVIYRNKYYTYFTNDKYSN